MSVSRNGTAEFWAGHHRLLVDFDAVGVHVDGEEIRLTPTQFKILACLARHAGRVVSVEEITAEVWGDWYGSGEHIFVYIHHIRERLGPCGRLIRTRRTMGYLLQDDPALDHAEPAQGPDGYVLSFDWDSRLLSIDPDGDFFGWEPSQIVGTRFEVDGIDVTALAGLAEVVLGAGDRIFTGSNAIGHADGSRVAVAATVHVTLTDGQRSGYSIHITVDEH